MRLTKDMKAFRKTFFINTRTSAKVKKLRDIVNFVSGNDVWFVKTETLLELVDQVDRVTRGEEFTVRWYTMDGKYLQIYITFAGMDFSFYCLDVLRTLEDFLGVECVIEEKQVVVPATTTIKRSVICNRTY